VWVNLNKELWESKEAVARMQASIDTLELENQELRETVSQLRALVAERAPDQHNPVAPPERETERPG
jgi:regulator of replication initiation timing